MNDSMEERQEAAMQRCDDLIGWYEKFGSLAATIYLSLQTVTVVLTALAPVLLLSEWFGPNTRVIAALLTALASIAASLTTLYRVQENRVRWGYTAEALKSEKLKFETRATAGYRTQLSPDEALDNFVTRIETLAVMEAAQWRAGLLHNAGESGTRRLQESK